ncbi:MAG TPA: 2Fe-2S iron-sulfur cluster-binding protein [Polyangiaceae bacterium]
MTTKKFTLDDREIGFEPGETIIQAAARAGIEIPHYCWHPGLSIAANCRMCLVEMLPPPGRKALMLDVLRYDAASGKYVKEQKPKLVPACQQPAAEGMVIRGDSSDYVKKARASVQEFLLLNHPVDCPICDQAGECRLQDYWLDHQHAAKRMRDEPVHKPKAVVFGPTIVYDAERCIACTRCIRFCDEVAKDPVLSLRQRGNLNEITVAPGRQLDNDYTLMTEAVCPVGALTARDFRFKARVWFLRSVDTICTGCARGCNSYTDFDPRNQKVYRYRARENLTVNRQWMCDPGMLSYQRIAEGRLSTSNFRGQPTTSAAAIAKAAELLRDIDGKKLAVLLGSQFSLEDNALLVWLGRKLSASSFFESGNPPGKGDDILQVPDKNPNSAGVQALLDGDPLPISELEQGIASGRFTHVLALGSRLKDPNADAHWANSQVTRIVLASHEGPLVDGAQVAIAVACWAEVEGTYVNVGGVAQCSQQAVQPPSGVIAAYRALSDLGVALGYLQNGLKLSQVRQMISADAPTGLEKIASINLPSLAEQQHTRAWGMQLGPSSDQIAAARAARLENEANL